MENDPNFFASKARSLARVLRLAMEAKDDDANADFIFMGAEVERFIDKAMDCHAQPIATTKTAA